MALVTLQDIQDAAARIEQFIHKTPVMTCSTIDNMAGRELFFKCENFQKVGAFKFRGGLNAVTRLYEGNKDDPPEIVTHSSGNHGQGIALAAKMKGLKAHVLMLPCSPEIKKASVRQYGARVIDEGITLEYIDEAIEKVLKEVGPNSHCINPCDNLDVIAGQGTMALELLEQVKDLDAIVAPVGGGGMISGISVAVKAIKPEIKVFAAEPIEADDCARSFAAGERKTLTGPANTICDGLCGNIGIKTWCIIRDNVEDVITVSEKEIISAMRLVWERMKLVIEPSAAVGLAAVLSNKFQTEKTKGLSRIGIIICGGNVDIDNLPWK